MKIKKLSEKKFNRTFKTPMRFLEVDDETSGVSLKEYLQKIIKKERLETSVEDIEIHYAYHTSDDVYEHILFNYGINELYMVIVIDIQKKSVVGYHILDLLDKYGINES